MATTKRVAGDPAVAESDLEFDGELLVPHLNLTAYRKIYALEGWLRRICLTAWMSRFGADWISELDPALRKTLEVRMERNRKRLYLGSESHSDVVWETTHTELLKLMVADKVVGEVRTLTGADPSFYR